MIERRIAVRSLVVFRGSVVASPAKVLLLKGAVAVAVLVFDDGMPLVPPNRRLIISNVFNGRRPESDSLVLFPAVMVYLNDVVCCACRVKNVKVVRIVTVVSLVTQDLQILLVEQTPWNRLRGTREMGEMS
jgi:hypothetical protein